MSLQSFIDLRQGETSVKILESIRDKDVFIVQSGSSKINDSIMELLIMISACKGGSAAKITGIPLRANANAILLTRSAIMPYFPYSRQSKKKAHRGAITARMLANLLNVAGVDHVVTVDLHATQMQGFFKCPVDNLYAEPLFARWIKHNVEGWREAVCVSKNAGGTKRVTSLADVLKLNFGLVTTDRRRGGNMSASSIMRKLDRSPTPSLLMQGIADVTGSRTSRTSTPQALKQDEKDTKQSSAKDLESAQSLRRSNAPSSIPIQSSNNAATLRTPSVQTPNPARSSPIAEEGEAEYTDERAKEVIHGRLVQGHIVSDDYPSPTTSAMSNSTILEEPDEDPMAMSRASSFFAPPAHALGGSGQEDPASSDEEEDEKKDPSLEQMITLVGDVKERIVFIVDDMIDKAGSWIAAAETVVKRGGAKKVYCIATHGLFGGDSLQMLQNCDCIDQIVVTNSFPISDENIHMASKLVVIDLSWLLSESIRRNHFGESISALAEQLHY